MIPIFRKFFSIIFSYFFDTLYPLWYLTSIQIIIEDETERRENDMDLFYSFQCWI
jgi:hypothetical protein